MRKIFRFLGSLHKTPPIENLSLLSDSNGATDARPQKTKRCISHIPFPGGFQGSQSCRWSERFPPKNCPKWSHTAKPSRVGHKAVVTCGDVNAQADTGEGTEEEAGSRGQAIRGQPMGANPAKEGQAGWSWPVRGDVGLLGHTQRAAAMKRRQRGKWCGSGREGPLQSVRQRIDEIA